MSPVSKSPKSGSSSGTAKPGISGSRYDRQSPRHGLKLTQTMQLCKLCNLYKIHVPAGVPESLHVARGGTVFRSAPQPSEHTSSRSHEPQAPRSPRARRRGCRPGHKSDTFAMQVCGHAESSEGSLEQLCVLTTSHHLVYGSGCHKDPRS